MPDYIFETSWEVCNRVGGIYTVLSSRARLMQDRLHDHVFFFGPDLREQSDVFFHEQSTLLAPWRKQLLKQGIRVRVGRWQIAGKPIAILIDYSHLWDKKNDIYAWAWEHFGVQSHAAYGDYDDSCLFGYAVGQTMHSLYQWLKADDKKVVAQCHEWQTAFAEFYLRDYCPAIGTIFTTHATGIGRSIAGNHKPLYDYFTAYNGDQMAQELGMVSKHSAEKQAAHHAHCFTTVSDLTARECTQLLERTPDVVTENGFEPDLVPTKRQTPTLRAKARKQLLQVAQQLSGRAFGQDTLICCISGRLEWKNKGIDVFLDAMASLDQHLSGDGKQVLAMVMVPYLDEPVRHYGNVTVVFCPYYLNGNDPLFHCTYYELLIGMDITIFPSYYEPWGYTPLESVAFSVPTITTDLSGFGQWVHNHYKQAEDDTQELQQTLDFFAEDSTRCPVQAVTVLHRTDSNTGEVITDIQQTLVSMMMLTQSQRDTLRTQAAEVAAAATWEHFFPKYEQAYQIALGRV